jgi:hypothetical protein
MNMNINIKILMPFCRTKNANLLKQSFANAVKGMRGTAELLPICSKREDAALFDSAFITPRPPRGWDICYWKLNWALYFLLGQNRNAPIGILNDMARSLAVSHKADGLYSDDGYDGKGSFGAGTVDLKPEVEVAINLFSSQPSAAGFDAATFETNRKLLRQEANTYVGFANDDDCWEPELFHKLEEAASGCQGSPKILITSMKWYRHEIRPDLLICKYTAAPSAMKPHGSGVRQYYVPASIMRGETFPNINISDGLFIEQLFQRRPADFLFLPELYVNWNGLPDARPDGWKF